MDEAFERYARRMHELEDGLPLPEGLARSGGCLPMGQALLAVAEGPAALDADSRAHLDSCAHCRRVVSAAERAVLDLVRERALEALAGEHGGAAPVWVASEGSVEVVLADPAGHGGPLGGELSGEIHLSAHRDEGTGKLKVGLRSTLVDAEGCPVQAWVALVDAENHCAVAGLPSGRSVELGAVAAGSYRVLLELGANRRMVALEVEPGPPAPEGP